MAESPTISGYLKTRNIIVMYPVYVCEVAVIISAAAVDIVRKNIDHEQHILVEEWVYETRKVNVADARHEIVVRVTQVLRNITTEAESQGPNQVLEPNKLTEDLCEIIAIMGDVQVRTMWYDARIAKGSNTWHIENDFNVGT